MKPRIARVRHARAMAAPTQRETELSEALARATAENAALRIELKLMREKVDALIQRLFGAQSDTISSN